MENTDIIYLIAFASYILVCMYRCGRRRQWDFNCFRLLTRHNSQEEDDLLHASIRNGLTGTFEQYQVNISRLALEEADPEARREFVMGRIVVKKVESFHDLRHVDDSTSSSPTCIDITNSINTGLSISIDDHLHHHRDEDGTGGSVVEKDKCHPQNDLDEESNSPTSLEQNKTLDRDDNDTSDHAGGDDQEDENDAKISQSLKSIFSSLKSSVFENESEDDDDELYNNNNNKNNSSSDIANNNDQNSTKKEEEKNISSYISTSYPNPQTILSQPYNTAFEGMDLSQFISWEGADAPPGFNEELGKRLGQLVLQDTIAATSVAKTSGAILATNLKPFNQSEEFIHRMESKASGNSGIAVSSLQTDVAKKNKEIEERQKKRAQQEIEKTKRITDVLSTGGFGNLKGRAITSSLMGAGGTERTGRPMRFGASSAYDFEYIEQLDMINNHSLVQADISPVELRHYWRPLLPRRLLTRGGEVIPWQFQVLISSNDKLKGKGGIGSSSINSYQSSVVNAMPGAISQAKIRKVEDLCPSEGDLVLTEFCEEKPLIKLTLGMSSKIINYYKGDKSRCPVSIGGGDRPIKKKKHGLDNQDSDLKGSSGKVEKPPRLEISSHSNTKDLIGKFGHSKKYNDDHNSHPSVTVLPEGVTEILHSKSHGPFLGEVKHGVTQIGLVNNLYVAPMFRHEPKNTDFLMILSKKHQGSNSSRLGVVLRQMPSNVYCVGQTEPKRKVFAPDSKGDKDFVGAFTTYQIAKALQRQERGLKFEEIKDGLFPYTEIPANPHRTRLKKVAVYDKNTQIWTLKEEGYEDFEGIGSLSRNFQPEGVAAHWCARASEQYLKDIGLQELSTLSVSVAHLGVIMNYYREIKEAAAERASIMKSYEKAAHNQHKQNHKLFVKAKERLFAIREEIERKVKIAEFIYEELQLTPWNLTNDFMDVHRNPQGTGEMKLAGLGDPSGLLSAGFSFLRATDKKITSTNDVNINVKDQVKKITGTDKDLRKLNMKEMERMLLSYKVPQQKIKTLKRWDRVHLIREYATKAASDMAGDENDRYARGEKTKLKDKISNYKERIQEIWERQRVSLQKVEDETMLEKAPEANAKKESGAVDEAVDDSDSENDDDDDDEDVFNDLKGMFETSKETNQLVRQSVDGDMKDAQHLAAFRRERDEDRAVKSSMQGSNQGPNYSEYRHNMHIGRKVIRKKITKTDADGKQKVTFKFIINCDEDKIAEVSKKLGKTSGFTNTVHKKLTKASNENVVGHSMFEEEEDIHKSYHSKRTSKSNRGRARRSDEYIPPRQKKPASQSKIKSKQEKRKKRKREEDEAPYFRHKVTNRKDRGSARELKPHALMANRLEAIRNECEKRENSGPFRRPVESIHVPNYYDIIAKPMDLQSIREKIRKYEYRTVDAFVEDFELMKNNAIKFNGNKSQLGNDAVSIYEFVKGTIEADRGEFTDLELAVEEQYNSSGVKKKGSRASTPKYEQATISGNLAKVTLDGVETQLPLGNIQNPFTGKSASNSDKDS
mmetsp:Transcript_9580/g.12123  ORF Transcript_9580/g.12123 Transcript_9580/m.12123 type:complete len:1513 (-) Transcript_9580:108-4646(-)